MAEIGTGAGPLVTLSLTRRGIPAPQGCYPIQASCDASAAARPGGWRTALFLFPVWLFPPGLVFPRCSARVTPRGARVMHHCDRRHHQAPAIAEITVLSMTFDASVITVKLCAFHVHATF